jgi:lipopolysaccharide transport system ATP-binding protein
MSDLVIKAENLGKKYVIGHQTENGPYLALRDVWMQNARTLPPLFQMLADDGRMV